jgi:hypothetical protein
MIEKSLSTIEWKEFLEQGLSTLSEGYCPQGVIIGETDFGEGGT